MRWLMITAALLSAHGAITSVGVAADHAWAPRVRPVRSEWCEQNLVLPGDFSASPGRFGFRGREYQREIIDAVDDVDTREIVLVAAPQIGKTEILRAIVQSQGEVDAAPMMLAGPDQPYAREQREIIYSGCEASEALRDLIPPVSKRNDRWIDLGKCYVFLAWSGSSQRLSGRSCKIVLCSEVDRWQLPVALAEKRTRAFWNHCVVYEGSPVGSSPNGWRLYKESDQRTFRVPCPHCGQYQELRFFRHKEGPYAGAGGVSGLQRADDSWKTADQARVDADYVCEKGCVIDNAEKFGMVEKGVWAPKGCDVVDGVVVGNPDHPGRRRGYQLNALYAPTVSFGDAAEYYLLHRDTEAGMMDFFNDWLGLPYQSRGKTPKWEDLGNRLAGAHALGYVPAAAYFLTGAADVHPDRVDWVVRAWGDGCTSWLVDFGSLHRPNRTEDTGGTEEQLAGDLAQLDAAMLDRKWPVLGENPNGYSQLAVAKMGVDCGFRATDVYAYVRAHPGERVIAVNGDPRISPGILYRKSEREKNARTGKPYPEGTTAWGIDTIAYKADIQGRWCADRQAPGAWWFTSDIVEIGETYLRQVVNEKARYEVDKKGKKILHFEPIDDVIGSHGFDCEVYNRCLADMIVGQEWDASKWLWGVSANENNGAAEELAAAGTDQDWSAR